MDFEALRSRMRMHPVSELGAGATDDEIRHAERLLRVRFRGGYRAFLKAFGWGGVEDIELFGLGADLPPHLDLITITESERREATPSLPLCLIPLANDGGGNLYCLDTSEEHREEHRVVFWNHEAGEHQEPEVVADDFVSWLAERLESRGA